MEEREIHRNVHGQDGQGNWLITLCAVSAVVWSCYKHRDSIYEAFRDAAAYVESIEPLSKCTMQALSGTPPIGCEAKIK